MCPSNFFFPCVASKIALAPLLDFHMSLTVDLSISARRPAGFLVGIVLAMLIHLENALRIPVSSWWVGGIFIYILHSLQQSWRLQTPGFVLYKNQIPTLFIPFAALLIGITFFLSESHIAHWGTSLEPRWFPFGCVCLRTWGTRFRPGFSRLCLPDFELS